MCEVDDCERPVRARNLCSKHYTRLMKHGSTDIVMPRGRPKGAARNRCEIDGCDDFVVSQKMCRKHYTRWRRYGDPSVVRRSYAPVRECTREGCTNEVRVYKGRPSKFCSPECYYLTGGEPRKYSPKTCEHCSSEYAPEGSRQRFCFTCIGDPVPQNNGLVFYPGQKRLLLYGVSAPEWDRLVAKHAGKCWICRTKDAVALDHCHVTGKIRGALCHHCNTRLHAIEDSGWLERASRYLNEISGENT